MKIVNMTPHEVTIIIGTQKVCIPPSGATARCAVTGKLVGTINIADVEVPLSEVQYGDLEGLPEPEEGTLYLVSNIVLDAAKRSGRTDVVAPDTAHAIRDAGGKIVGVPGLVR